MYSVLVARVVNEETYKTRCLFGRRDCLEDTPPKRKNLSGFAQETRSGTTVERNTDDLMPTCFVLTPCDR